HKRHDRNLVRPHLTLTTSDSLVAMLIARLATDPRLVSDHGSAQQTLGRTVLHRLAQPMRHEPRGLRRDAVLALNLTRCDPVLVRTHFKDDEQPRSQLDLAAMKHGAGGNGELLAARLALP